LPKSGQLIREKLQPLTTENDVENVVIERHFNDVSLAPIDTAARLFCAPPPDFKHSGIEIETNDISSRADTFGR
jgi:hypothetical protein